MFSSENKRKIIKHHTYPKLIRWECWCFSNQKGTLHTVHIYVDYFFQKKKSIEPWQTNKLQIMKNNLKRIYSKNKPLVFATIYGLVRLAYKPYFFNQRTIFFSHNKSVNSTLSHGLSKWTWQYICSLFLLRCWDLGEITPAPTSYPVYSASWRLRVVVKVWSVGVGVRA